MEKLKAIRIPGVAWVALVMAVVAWLEGDWFQGEPWVPAVVLILTTAGKLLQMYFAYQEEEYHVQRHGLEDDAPIGGQDDGWFSAVTLLLG